MDSHAASARALPWAYVGKSGLHLIEFTRRQVASSVFPLAIFCFLAFSRRFDLLGLPRYDLLLILCLAMQVVMVRAKLETRDELKVICVFHVLGLALELYKTQHGSWAYPEAAYTKLGTVPLYSGFMYASVASYISQAWRRFNLRIGVLPRFALPLAVGIYANFFTLHYLPDCRWLLMVGVAWLFRRSFVDFDISEQTYRMRLPVAFLLIGFFLWVAENIGTRTGAWQYPNQAHGWQVVSFSKAGSWFLLVIVSFVIVAWLKRQKLSEQ